MRLIPFTAICLFVASSAVADMDIGKPSPPLQMPQLHGAAIDLNQYTARVDHAIGAKMRMFGRYSQQTGLNPGFTGDASIIIPGPLNPGSGANHPVDRQFSLNYNQTIGSNLLFTGK